jgi:hypothetical protein
VRTAALERINELLALGESRYRLRRVAEANSFERVPSHRKRDGREIRRGQPGSWREATKPEEIDAMYEILEPKLAELGMLAEQRPLRAA